MTPESGNSTLLGKGGKQVSAETYTQATIEELLFLSNAEVNTPF
jgi:hypothetical protein